MKQKRYQMRKDKFLLDDEISRLETVLNKFINQNTRDCVLLFTLLYTGARASEVLAVRASDVSDGTVLIRGLKGSLDREVPVPDWLYARLKTLAQTGLIFPISYKRLQQIWYHYRPIDKKLHCLRHTFAILLVRKHGRIDVIKQFLGHVSIQNTMVYANYAYSRDELRKMAL